MSCSSPAASSAGIRKKVGFHLTRWDMPTGRRRHHGWRRRRHVFVTRKVKPDAARKDGLFVTDDHWEHFCAGRSARRGRTVVLPHDVRLEGMAEDIRPVEEQRELVVEIVAR